MSEGDDEEQGSDDKNDLLVLFGSLGKQLKTFQRDLTRTDKKVESAKKYHLRCGKKEETTLVAKQSLFMLCRN